MKRGNISRWASPPNENRAGVFKRGTWSSVGLYELWRQPSRHTQLIVFVFVWLFRENKPFKALGRVERTGRRRVVKRDECRCEPRFIRFIQWSKRPNHTHHKTKYFFKTSPFLNRVGNSVSNYINKSVHFFLFWETLIKGGEQWCWFWTILFILPRK